MHAAPGVRFRKDLGLIFRKGVSKKKRNFNWREVNWKSSRICLRKSEKPRNQTLRDNEVPLHLIKILGEEKPPRKGNRDGEWGGRETRVRLILSPS